MQENRNRKLKSFNFDITYRCQLRCRHCYNCSGSQDFGVRELDDMEAYEMMRDVMKLAPETVWICGGEPLLRIDLIYKILSMMPESGMCHMLTNGWGMTDAIAETLKEKGIGTVQLSLDGAKPYTHNWMRKNPMAFDHAICAIHILKEHGIHTSVACTPYKKNFPEMNDIIDLCLLHQVDELKFQTMRRLGRAQDITDEFLTADQYQSLSKIVEKRKDEAAKSGLTLAWGDSNTHVSKLKQGRITEDINVSAYGELLLSPYLPSHLVMCVSIQSANICCKDLPIWEEMN
jgi:MoaA/NifB/PqqE/SkfB family radical SAM enzyme